MKSEIHYYVVQLADELTGVEPDEAKSVVGDRIRRARKAAGLTAKELGEKLDPPVSQSGISSWERGRTTPSVEMRDQLEKVFDGLLDEIDKEGPRFERYFVEYDTSPKRKEVEDKLFMALRNISTEGIEYLVDYAEFLGQKYPAITVTEEEEGKGQ